MTEIQAQTIGKRGSHPNLGERFHSRDERETQDPDTVEAQSKDETPPGSLEWKEDRDDESL